MERKIKRISIRITEREYKAIKNSKIKLSDIFSYGMHGITKDNTKELIKEINKIGTNLNQLTKIANKNNDTNIFKELKGIKNDLQNIIFKITNK